MDIIESFGLVVFSMYPVRSSFAGTREGRDGLDDDPNSINHHLQILQVSGELVIERSRSFMCVQAVSDLEYQLIARIRPRV